MSYQLLTRSENWARFRALLIVALLLAFTTACAVRLIAEYDEVLDHSITDFQQKTELFLAKLESNAGTPDATYANSKDFYDQAVATLNTMRVRALASSKNSLMVQQVDLLKSSVEDLRKLHEDAGAKGLTRGEIDAARSALETHFESMLKLELALKRGKTARNAPLAPQWMVIPATAQGN